MKGRTRRRMRIAIIILLALVAWHFILNIPPRKYPIFKTPASSFAMDDFLAANAMMRHRETLDRIRFHWQDWDVTIEGLSKEKVLATLTSVLKDNAEAIDSIRQGLNHEYLKPLDPREVEQRYGQKQNHYIRGDISDLLTARIFDLSMHNNPAAADALIDYWQFLFLNDDTGVFSPPLIRPLEHQAERLTAEELRLVVGRLENVLSKRVSCAESIRRERPYFLYCCSDWSRLYRYDEYRWYTPRWVMAIPIWHPNHPLEARNPVVNQFWAWTTPNFALPQVADRYLTAAIKAAEQPISSHPSYPGTPHDDFTFTLFARTDRKSDHLKYQFSIFQQDGCMLSLALKGYRKTHGHYPARLEDLVAAKWLTRLPVDPFTLEGTFGYRTNDKTFTLYSKGPDGKDDAGKPIDEFSKRTGLYYIHYESRGDVVYGRHDQAAGDPPKYTSPWYFKE